MYGIITDKGITAYEKQVPGSKEMIYAEPECPDGYRPVYEWIEDGDKIVQNYTYIPLTAEEIEENERRKADEEATADDYENALSDLGVSV